MNHYGTKCGTYEELSNARNIIEVRIVSNMAQEATDCYISLFECLTGVDNIIMAEKNEIATEVCRDHQENHPPVRWQKQVSNSKGDSPEIASRGNSHIQDKGIFQKNMIIQASESASTPVQCKPAHSGLSSSGSVCRICHEDDSSENLISPCDCTGTLGLVHKSCLEKWLSASNKTECEICKYRFNTNRQPRSVWQWFRSHKGSNCHQGLYGDVLCLLILTPPCLVSIYLCGMGSAMYIRHGLWEAMGLAMLCCFLFITFLLWVAITVRFHLMRMRRWQRMNQMIQLIDVQYCQGAGMRQQRKEVNNNGHPEEGNSNASSQVVETIDFV